MAACKGTLISVDHCDHTAEMHSRQNTGVGINYSCTSREEPDTFRIDARKLVN